MVDLDTLVNMLLGTEGRARYQRIGIILIVVPMVLIVATISLPIYETRFYYEGRMIEEDSWTYFEMADDRVMWEPFLDKINTSIVFFLLLVLFGILMVLQGSGKVSLFKFVNWDDEVQATALYAIGTTLALVGVIGMAHIWGMSLHTEEWTIDGEEYRGEIISPAGRVVTPLGILLLFGLLFMTAYSTTLASYRRGLDTKALRLSRLTSILAIASVLGAIALPLMGVVNVHYSDDIGAPGWTRHFDGTEPYTVLGIDIMAHIPGAHPAVEQFDRYLTMAGWCLLLSSITALVACVGVSAMGVGGGSRRTYLAMSSPAIIVVFGIITLTLMALALSIVQGVAEGLHTLPDVPFESSDVTGSAGFGAYLILAISLLITVLSIHYVRTLGKSALLAALGTVPVSDVDVAPVAPAEGGAPKKAPTPLPRGSVLLIGIVLSIIFIGAIVGAYWFLGGGDDDGDGGDGHAAINIESLGEFSETFSVDSYLIEGSTEIQDIQVQFCDLYAGGDTTYFVDSMVVTLTWVDEADQQNPVATYENQPDTFGLELVDADGSLISMYEEGSNPHGAEGEIVLHWSSSGPWIVWGNESIEVRDTYITHMHHNVDANVMMVHAGNKEAPRRPIAYTDDGNEYTMSVTVSGRMFAHD